MRKAYIVKSINEKFKRLLSKTTFIFLNSHWFINFYEDNQGIYIIRIDKSGDDIEYHIKNYNDDEIVTDNLEIATLLVEINEAFMHINDRLFEEYITNDVIGLDMFSASKAVIEVELEQDSNLKIYLKS